MQGMWCDEPREEAAVDFCKKTAYLARKLGSLASRRSNYPSAETRQQNPNP